MLTPQRIASADALLYRIDLDPREPFLDDHRPGGAPLFGTVMSLEAVASAVTATAAGWVSTISDVNVAVPYILFDESIPHCVHVRVQPLVRDRYRCILLTRVPGRTEVTHLQATIELVPDLPLNDEHVALAANLPENAAVTGELIYRQFFHGPSFRVIHRARFQHGSLWSRLAPGLPASTNSKAKCCISPRVLEFGLQTAGLLELASSGRMMIPHSIERIERRSDLDVDTQQPLYAHAFFCPQMDRDHIDIDISDAHGRVVARIHGYRTVALPFPSDDSGLAKLAAALQAAARR